MVESYVSDKRLIARRRMGDIGIAFQDATLKDSDAVISEDTLQNGSLMTVCCSPWVGLGTTKADKQGITNQLIQVILETEGGKPRLSLVAQQRAKV